MSLLNRFWNRVMHVINALEGMDDPIGGYMDSLGERIDKLERDVVRIESQRRPGGSSGQAER